MSRLSPAEFGRSTAWALLLAGSLACALAPAFARAECAPSRVQEADLAYGTAKDFLDNQRWLAAIPSLESALSICDEHVPTLQALAMAYRQAGDLSKARGDSLKGAGDATGAESAQQQATALWTKSRGTYARLIAIPKREPEAPDYAGYGLTLVRLKDYANARATYLKARAKLPRDCEVLFNLGILHMAAQDFRSSVETLEETLEICPDLAERIYPNLTNACKRAAEKESKIGNTAEAEAFNRKYQEYAGQAGGSTSYELAVNKMKQKQWDEAIALFQKVVEETPQKKPAWLNLARCQKSKGDHAAAVAALEKYLALSPDDVDAHAEMVEVLALSNRCAEAKAFAAQAVTTFAAKGQQRLGQLNYHYGEALECLGEFSGAKERFRQAATSGDPDLTSLAARKMERQDQLIQREAARRKQQQGG